jgi:hypothetical protein
VGLDIPAGKSRQDIGATVEFTSDILTQYQQGIEKTCMIHSFCSALHFPGLANEACKLQRQALEYEKLPGDAQIRKLASHLRNEMPSDSIREVEMALKAKSTKTINIYSPKENSINVAIIETTDGAADHAITIANICGWNPLVFDSNDKNPMELTPATLDHRSGADANYAKIRQHLCPSLKQRNTEKKKRKQPRL